ncbi:hypothetical protein [Rhodocaloribacter sp.]|jgi:hypothetical protein
MGIFIPSNRRTQHRRFSYEPRFYNPEKEQKLKHRMRVKSMSRARRRSPVGIVYFIVMLALIVYVFLKLG